MDLSIQEYSHLTEMVFSEHEFTPATVTNNTGVAEEGAAIGFTVSGSVHYNHHITASSK